ncbi:uncharacterized protein MELLADRAFT_111589 [Melampsora larici-populina 98AG31]|uniref:CxC1-like cysteine cluster associated with KDZ transposases domain-containing protein n=1 Tax=Melampsora larici-populina (strain 98AG31 / pathotype 3-4-7) TaxID=747676 RepID=F4S3P5_MELLP|nr:uncharacterized protein MELLADRAFT_111589 [Melampsora larici-populina 98AG31]EGG00759.1 hypothetical protein MELLADRAFT_111589 [Melampsora larici-populina 98AG31]
MGKHHHSGFNADMFGHGNKRSRRAKKLPSSATMTRDEALKINQSLGLLKIPQDLNSPYLEQDNQDELNWEDVDDGVGVGIEIRPDSPGDCYARHQKSLRRVEARARIQERSHQQTPGHILLKPQQVKKASTKNINRSLRHPFTQSIDIYRRILLGEQVLYEDGLELTPLDISANRCCRCFGPAEGEVKLSPEEPDFIIAMDGNFQHCHQSHASKDCPQEDQYPHTFIRPSKLEKEVVACQRTDAQAHNIKASILKQLRELYPDKFIGILYDIGCHLDEHIAKWLWKRFRNAMKVLREAEAVVTSLSRSVFKQAGYPSEAKVGTWTTIMLKRRVGPRLAIARLQTTTELEEKIRKQAAKVGTTDISNLDKEQEAFLKLWYSHKGKTNLMVALRRHTAQLKKLVETYRTLRAEYHAEYPEHQLPEDITYNDLLEIQADHPFWNDSLFTEIEAPWAVDPNTRHGMQQIAYVDRGNEELRRLGWEVRRAMRWATTSHDHIWSRLISLSSEPTPEPNLLTPLLTHPTLIYLPPSARRDAAAVIMKNQYIKITNLQLTWHEGLHEVFTQSQYQIVIQTSVYRSSVRRHDSE